MPKEVKPLPKEVKFSVPHKTTEFTNGQIAKPLCQTAAYLCMLARKDKLSLKELYIVQKIGFSVNISYEKNSV